MATADPFGAQGHPTDEDLTEVLEERSTPELSIAVADHLKRCADCAQRQQKLRSDHLTQEKQFKNARLTSESHAEEAGCRESSRAILKALRGKGPDGVAPAEPRPDGEWPALPHDLLNSLEKYREIRVIGSGGMGTVFEAVDATLDRRVALKVPHPWSMGQDRQLARFRFEAHALAKLDHPNICQVYEVGEIQKVHYLAMRLIKGEKLSDHLKRQGQLEERKAAALVKTLAEAMQYAHDRKVIHRDLKLSNVMLDENGNPVITDFGLATSPSQVAGEPLTRQGEALGSVGYMAPEQARGDVTETHGPACDVYALGGVILHELLTGRRPFQHKEYNELHGTLLERPDPPSRHRPGLSPKLDAICLKALEKEPHHRFASMQHLVAALAEYLEDQVPIEPSHDPGSREQYLPAWVAVIAFTRSVPPWAWVVALVVLVLLVGGVSITVRPFGWAVQSANGTRGGPPDEGDTGAVAGGGAAAVLDKPAPGLERPGDLCAVKGVARQTGWVVAYVRPYTESPGDQVHAKWYKQAPPKFVQKDQRFVLETCTFNSLASKFEVVAAVVPTEEAATALSQEGPRLDRSVQFSEPVVYEFKEPISD